MRVIYHPFEHFIKGYPVNFASCWDFFNLSSSSLIKLCSVCRICWGVTGWDCGCRYAGLKLGDFHSSVSTRAAEIHWVSAEADADLALFCHSQGSSAPDFSLQYNWVPLKMPPVVTCVVCSYGSQGYLPVAAQSRVITVTSNVMWPLHSPVEKWKAVQADVPLALGRSEAATSHSLRRRSGR